MNKRGIIIVWFLISMSNGFLTPEPASTENVPQDKRTQNAGYPKPGEIPVLNRKIFKGQRVSIREHPYVASVRRLCSHYLTGAIISKTVVLTVAHPLQDVPVQELNIVLGESYCDRGSALLTVILVVIHQDFDPYTLSNDIAMLRIYETINIVSNVKALLLSPLLLNIPMEGNKAFVTGWGRCDNVGTELCLDRTSKYYPDEKLDPMLRTVSFPYTSNNSYCEGYKRHEVILRPGMLCAGVAREEDQVTPCLGVPGALLLIEAKLAGILSWGFGCGYNYDLPLVYSDLMHFLPWILHNNRIFYDLKQRNLTVLFEATKSTVLAQWLLETRTVTPKLNIRTDKNIEALPIDTQLAQLEGTIYDIRDFISDGAFKNEKAYIYSSLRQEYVKNQTSSPKIPLPKLRPFLSNKSRKDADYS